MARTTRRKGAVVKPPQRPEVNLPELRPYEPAEGGSPLGGLRPDGDYDGVGFTDVDLGGTDGAGSTFLDCAHLSLLAR